MLRALGGCEVKFRCPVAASKNGDPCQLGLFEPLTEDLALSPIVVRGSGDDLELLVAPSSVAPYMQDRGQTAEQFFGAVLAVFVVGREWRVKLFHVEQFAGAAYLYLLSLTPNS